MADPVLTCRLDRVDLKKPWSPLSLYILLMKWKASESFVFLFIRPIDIFLRTSSMGPGSKMANRVVGMASFILVTNPSVFWSSSPQISLFPPKYKLITTTFTQSILIDRGSSPRLRSGSPCREFKFPSFWWFGQRSPTIPSFKEGFFESDRWTSWFSQYLKGKIEQDLPHLQDLLIALKDPNIGFFRQWDRLISAISLESIHELRNWGPEWGRSVWGLLGCLATERRNLELWPSIGAIWKSLDFNELYFKAELPACFAKKWKTS